MGVSRVGRLEREGAAFRRSTGARTDRSEGASRPRDTGHTKDNDRAVAFGSVLYEEAPPTFGRRGFFASTPLPFRLVIVRAIPLLARAFAAYPRCACGIPRSLANSLLTLFYGVCRKAMGDVREGVATMDTFAKTTTQVGEYEVPVDPMDDLECESCQ